MIELFYKIMNRCWCSCDSCNRNMPVVSCRKSPRQRRLRVGLSKFRPASPGASPGCKPRSAGTEPAQGARARDPGAPLSYGAARLRGSRDRPSVSSVSRASLAVPCHWGGRTGAPNQSWELEFGRVGSPTATDWLPSRGELPSHGSVGDRERSTRAPVPVLGLISSAL